MKTRLKVLAGLVLLVFLTVSLTLVALAETSDGHENLFQPEEVGLAPDGIGLLATFSVDSTTDASDANVGDGNCQTAGGQCTLRAAIEEANHFPPVDNDTIMVPENIYTLTLGELLIDSPVTIVGDGANKTIIDGGGQPPDNRVFMIEPTGDVTLTGVTVRNGVDTRGAGILNQGTLQLIDSTVFSNATTTSDGGGIRNELLTVRRPVLTVTNSLITGNTGQGGGGIFNEDGTVTINDSIISENTATVPVDPLAPVGLGGGIANSAETADATVTVNQSMITTNTVEGVGGGGISNSADANHSATVILNQTVVSDNSAMEVVTLNANVGLGGGIRNGFFGTADSTAKATVTLNDSTVSGNDAVNGGGIANATTLTTPTLTLEVTVNDSTVSGNTTVANGATLVGNGGGLINVNGTISLVNSTVSGNAANGTHATGGFGGGIFNGDLNRATTLWLTNTTISSNTVANDGEGVTVYQAGSATPDANFKNSIINGGCFNSNGTLTSHGNNLDDDDTCELTASGDITNTNPRLEPLQDNGDDTTPHTETHALLDGSPALGAGDNAACPATDQRGVSRPAGDADCDIGAYESASTSGGGVSVYLPIVIKS